MLGLDGLVADVVEGAVIEDVAVLENLDERCAAMIVRALERLAEMLLFDVDGAGDEGGMRSERQRDRVERKIHGTRRASTW